MNKNILVRKAKVGDEKGVVEMIKEGLKRKTSKYTGNNKVPNAEKIAKMRKQYENWGDDGFFFLAIDKKTKKVVGSIMCGFKSIGRLRHRIDCGWGVHPDYQGQGIATKLLNTLLTYAKKKGFKKAEAECAIENIASWKLAKKCGFEIEGTKKKALLTDDGRYIDTYIVGKVLK
jgi:RimJ/RimL family protein N-acetyltransferase